MTDRPRNSDGSRDQAPVGKCPSEPKLNRWLRGNLDLKDAEHLEQHVSGCRSCQAILEHLTDVPGLIDTRHLRIESCGDDDPQLVRLKNRMASLNFDDVNRQRPLAPGLSETDVAPLDTVLNSADTFSKLPPIAGIRIECEIGRGGFCTVYAAWDERLQQHVAVKILNADRLTAEHRQRFFREARTIELLENPHVVRVYRLDETETGIPFLVMELVRGGSLKDRIDNFHELATDQIFESARLILDVTQGLIAVHEAGFLHRDIKPSNVLIDAVRDPENSSGKSRIIPKLADFGLVKFAENSSITLTRAAEIVGTPAFMSPEQTHGEIKLTEASDIYSLGATLYFAVTGQPPFVGSTLAVIQQIQRGEMTNPRRLNPFIPKHLEAVCLKAMAFETSRRYQTVMEFANDIERALNGKATRAKPDNSWQRTRRWARRNRIVSSLGVLLFASLLIGAVATTVLWKLSERNAMRSSRLANDLVSSRERMRESIERFQSRVFADESLYLQMSSQLRRELFNDVITYLDEYATSEQASPKSNSVSDKDRIAENYLNIARAASTVEEYAEAKVASERALQRISRCLNVDSDDVAKLAQQSEAARILFNAQANESFPDDIEHEMIELAISSAKRASSLQPGNKTYRLKELRARFCLRKTEAKNGRLDPHAISELSAMLGELRQHLETKHDPYPVQEDNLKLQMEIGLWLLDHCEDSQFEEQFTLLAKDLVVLRELYRSRLMKPMTSTHAIRGRLFVREAKYLWRKGKQNESLVSLQNAENFFEKATLPSPNNRKWRLEYAIVQQQQAECLDQLGRHNQAVEINDLAIKNLAHLTESDVNDHEARKLMIVLMIRHGEIQERIGDSSGAFRGFYSAAQECNLLLFEGSSDAGWAWPVRIWALSRAIRHIDNSESELEKIYATQTHIFERQAAIHDVDIQTALSVLTEDFKPERPPHLRDSIVDFGPWIE